MNQVNAMTVDVEDYFQVSDFEPYIARHQWNDWPHRVADNTRRILELFEQKNVTATFFTLGWVAERYPKVVREIVASGHELACHGLEHVRVTEQTPAQFREDVIHAKQLFEDVSGVEVFGYRAASYSIGRDNLWALTVLEEVGFRYSSSIYPVKHDLYGMPEAPRFAFHPEEAEGLLEIPISTIRLGEANVPCGGGGYFRLYPYPLSRWAMRRINRVEGQPVVFYFHPWEIDPQQPRPPGLRFKTRFRHYLNLGRMEDRLNKLIDDFNWNTMATVFLTNDEN